MAILSPSVPPEVKKILPGLVLSLLEIIDLQFSMIVFAFLPNL